MMAARARIFVIFVLMMFMDICDSQENPCCTCLPPCSDLSDDKSEEQIHANVSQSSLCDDCLCHKRDGPQTIANAWRETCDIESNKCENSTDIDKFCLVEQDMNITGADDCNQTEATHCPSNHSCKINGSQIFCCPENTTKLCLQGSALKIGSFAFSPAASPVYPLCNNSICLNGGTCYMVNSKSMCTCPPKWTGSLCDKDLQPCEPNPCMHNATCTEKEGNKDGVDCNCALYYTGPKCEEYDPCAFGPCQNGGTCNETTEDWFECLCTEQYEGDTCGVDKCDSIVCQNGGRCIITDMKPTCNCSNGFRGEQCQLGYKRYKVKLIASPIIDHLQFHVDLLNKSTERYNQSSTDVRNAFYSLCSNQCRPIHSISFTRGSIRIEVHIDVDDKMKTTAFLEMLVRAIDDKTFLPDYNISSDSVEIEDANGDILQQSQYILKSLCDPFDDLVRLKPKKTQANKSKRATLQIAIDTEDIPHDISACECLFEITKSNSTKLRTEFSLQNRAGDQIYTENIEFRSCGMECCEIYRPRRKTSDWFKPNRIDGTQKFSFKLKQGAPDVDDILKLHVLYSPVVIELSCGMDLNINLPKTCPSKEKKTKTTAPTENRNVLGGKGYAVVVGVSVLVVVILGAIAYTRLRKHKQPDATQIAQPALSTNEAYRLDSKPQTSTSRDTVYETCEYNYISEKDMERVKSKIAKADANKNRKRLSIPNVYKEGDRAEGRISNTPPLSPVEEYSTADRGEVPDVKKVVVTQEDYSLAGECVLPGQKKNNDVKESVTRNEDGTTVDEQLCDNPNEDRKAGQPKPMDESATPATLADQGTSSKQKKLNDSLVESQLEETAAKDDQTGDPATEDDLTPSTATDPVKPTIADGKPVTCNLAKSTSSEAPAGATNPLASIKEDPDATKSKTENSESGSPDDVASQPEEGSKRSVPNGDVSAQNEEKEQFVQNELYSSDGDLKC